MTTNDSHLNSALDGRVASAFPVLQTIEWTLPREAEGFSFNALGARARHYYMPPNWFDEVNLIKLNEQMFEWVTIAESILGSGDHYVTADLGAGFGRWLVNAAFLAHQFGRVPYVIGVEAEDTHFSWMEEHVTDNHIPLTACRLLHAPVTGKRQDVAFPVGHAEDWYGQAVLPSPDACFGRWPHAQVEIRQSILLEDIISDISVVDLVALDIQGMEAEVVASSIDLIGRRVKRIHVGTHNREIEDTLRKLMATAGWQPRFDYPCGARNYPTSAGPVNFQDGVQSWINPRFA